MSSVLASPPRGLQLLSTLLRRFGPSEPDRRAALAFQRRALAALVAHCRRNVALYREHWRDADPTEARLDALPTIGKDDFRSRPLAAALADGVDPRSLVVHTTSGSSGQPFAVRRTRVEDHLMQLFRVRAEAGAGVRRTDRALQFGQVPAGGFRRSWPGRVAHALRWYRHTRLDGLADAAKLADELLRVRPDVLLAYPSTLAALAAELARRNGRYDGTKFVFSGGEVLGASTRRMIADVLGGRIVDCYGAHEFNLIASECPAGRGFHVCDDNVIVEVLGEDGRPVAVGATGEVVATALHAYAMPFVRYRTGDLAELGPAPCSCGAPWSTLRAIRGRAVDLIRRPDGSSVHPYAITGTLADDDADWVAQHQLVQRSVDRVVLSMAVRRPPRPDELERVRRNGAAALGPGVAFDVTIVGGFAHPAGAKFPPYVSLVERDARAVAGGAT